MLSSLVARVTTCRTLTLLNTLLFTFVPFNITLTFLFLTVTRSKTKGLLLDIDLEDLLAAEEAERIQRLENGYESEDSLAGDESEEDEADLLIDPEFSRMKTPTDRFVDDLLFDLKTKMLPMTALKSLAAHFHLSLTLKRKLLPPTHLPHHSLLQPNFLPHTERRGRGRRVQGAKLMRNGRRRNVVTRGAQ